MPASETTQPPAPGAKSGGAKHKSAGAGGQPAGAARDESAGPRKYASEVAQLRQIFPDYTPDELVEALESKYGDVDLVVDLIASGKMSRWESTTVEKTKKSAAKPSAGSGDEASMAKPAAASEKPFTSPVPISNGIPARGGFRGARGGGMVGRGGRGGARGGRGGIVLANGQTIRLQGRQPISTPVAAPSMDSEALKVEGEPAPTVSADTLAEPAATTSDGWTGAAAGEPVVSARKPPQQKPIGAIGAKPASAPGARTPAKPVAAAPAPAPIPSGTKTSWAQIAAPPPPPKPEPKAAPAPPAPAPAPVAEPPASEPSAPSRDQSPSKAPAAAIVPPGLANKAPAPAPAAPAPIAAPAPEVIPEPIAAPVAAPALEAAVAPPAKKAVKQEAAVVMPSTQQSIIKENLEALGVRFGSLGVQSPTEAQIPVSLESQAPAAAVVEEQQPVVPEIPEPAAPVEEAVEERMERADAGTQISQPTNGLLGETIQPQPGALDLGALGTSAATPQQLYSGLNGLTAGGLWPNFSPADYLSTMQMYGFNQAAAQSPELTLAAMNRVMMGYYDPSSFGQAPQGMAAGAPAPQQPARQPQQLAPGGRPSDAAQQRFQGMGPQQGEPAPFGSQPGAGPAIPAMTQGPQAAPQSTAAQLGGMPYFQQPYYFAPPVQQFAYPGAGANQPSLNAYNQRGYGMGPAATGPAGAKQQSGAGNQYYGGYGFGPDAAPQGQSQLNDYNKSLYGMGNAGFGGFGGPGLPAQDAGKLGGYGKQGGYDSQMQGGGQRSNQQQQQQQSGYYQNQGYGNQGYYQGSRSGGYANWNQQN